MKNVFIVMIGIFCLITLPASAEYAYSDDFRYSVQLDDSLLSENTDLNNSETIKEDLEFENIFLYLWRQIQNSLGKAANVLGSGIALILLSSILNQGNEHFKSFNVKWIFSLIINLSIVLICEENLRYTAASLQRVIEDVGVFINACIPAFSVVMIAAGEGGSGTAFSAALLFWSEIGSLISNHLLMPLTDVYLSIGLCSAMSDELKFANIAKNVRRFVYWFIGVFVAVFRVILGLQNTIAATGDQLTKKYIRTAVGGLIPIVGGSLSQGVDSLFAVAAGVKTTFAIAGVLLILSIVLPVLIDILVSALCWSFCKWLADFMGDTTTGKVSEILANCYYLMLAMGGCVVLLGLFSFFGVAKQLG